MSWSANATNSNPKRYTSARNWNFFFCVVKISFWSHYLFGLYILIIVNLIHVIFNLHLKSGFKQVTWLKKKVSRLKKEVAKPTRINFDQTSYYHSFFMHRCLKKNPKRKPNSPILLPSPIKLSLDPSFFLHLDPSLFFPSNQSHVLFRVESGMVLLWSTSLLTFLYK